MTTLQECFIKDIKNTLDVAKRIELFIKLTNESLPNDPKTIDLIKAEFNDEKNFILDYVLEHVKK